MANTQSYSRGVVEKAVLTAITKVTNLPGAEQNPVQQSPSVQLILRQFARHELPGHYFEGKKPDKRESPISALVWADGRLDATRPTLSRGIAPSP
jgi:hypothetical protein